MDLTKLYYSIRNRSYFDVRTLRSSSTIYGMNVVAIICLMFLRALRKERRLFPLIPSLRVVLAALFDGWRGRLGRVA
jgi:hypothetical protein